MATYKVIQDIEAEDKLIGPLTLRQFIYAAIACVAGYLSFIAVTKHVAFMLVFLVPVALASAFFAFPWKGEQPTEIWALAKIRFLLKPRRRIWDQSGAQELVTVTVPKHIQVDYTNGLSQNEVHSRLRALADTIDSRGWAIKNSNLNVYTQPALVMTEPTSDRLLGPSALPEQVSGLDIQAADDMLDETSNRVAQQVDTMIEASAKAHRSKIVESLSRPTPPPMPAPQAPPTPAAPANNYWFLNQAGQSASVPNNMVTFNTQVVTPGTPEEELPQAPAIPDQIGQPDEQQLMQELKARKEQLPMTAYYGHLHTIQPLSAQKQQAAQQQAGQTGAPAQQRPMDASAYQQAAAQPQQAAPASAGQQPFAAAPPPAIQGSDTATFVAAPTAPEPVTPTQQTAILQLANNNDLNVSTIAREAVARGLPEGEVVIKLH
jgi:hypothetical protein